MTPELTVLALAGLLQGIQFVLMAVPANLQLGTRKTLGARDPEVLGRALADQMSPVTGRLYRAMNNHFEGLVLFTIAVVVVTLGAASTPFTQTCAWVYLAARVAYIPAYALGLTPWRSLIWSVGFGATMLMIGATII